MNKSYNSYPKQWKEDNKECLFFHMKFKDGQNRAMVIEIRTVVALCMTQ